MLWKNILEGTEDSVDNPSPRTGDSVANPSQRFLESPRNIYTLSSVSRRTANLKSTKIRELLTKDYENLRTAGSVVNPSQRF
jgi:hypothetical protein